MTIGWTINHFSQSNPVGDSEADVPALLRRVADTIEKLGNVQVQDITFASQVIDGEDDLTMTVYYHPAEGSHLTVLQQGFTSGRLPTSESPIERDLAD